MKETKKLSLQEEAAKEAERIEKEVLSKEELLHVEATEEMDRGLEEKIRAYEAARAGRHAAAGENGSEDRPSGGEEPDAAAAEHPDGYMEEFAEELDVSGMAEHFLSAEDREALELGRKVMEKRAWRRTPKRRRAWIALIAILVLLFALGITGVGSKSYLKELWERVVGTESHKVINVEDMETVAPADGEKAVYYQEIAEELDINPVHPWILPEKTILKRVEIDKTQRMAKVIFDHDGQMILYAVYVNDQDSSYTENVKDVLTDTFEVETDKQKIVVEEYLIEETNEHRYLTFFEYAGIQYQLMGVMERAEFEEILKNLYYY